jgi:predicted TPR repeat methyltransferase
VMAEEANRYARQQDLASLRHRAVELNEQVRAAMRRCATATDATGAVEATVRADGSVEGLYVSPRAVRDLPARQLGAACVEAVAAARSAIVSELADWLAELNRHQAEG